MACLVDVNDWMRANRLRLNADKTQLIWPGSRQQLEKINVADVQFMSANLRPLPSVRNLAVILDNRLSTADQGAYPTAICRACYYQLRQLHNVLHSLIPETAKTLVHAFISCRLDSLQCLVVRHCGQPVSTTAVSAERRGAVGHWFSAIWTHHAGPALVALVTRPSASHVQAGNACPQRPGPDVPG